VICILKRIILISIAVNAKFIYSQEAYDVNCGPKALMGICKDFNKKTTIQEIKELSWYNPEYGTTMLGLMHASEKLQLPVVPLTIGLDDLRKIEAPCIAYLKDRHYTIVRNIRKEDVVVQDWPKQNHELSRDEFESIWSKEV